MTFDESLKPETTEKPKELPQLSAEQIRAIQSRLPEVRQDITRLLGHFDDLRTNYPDEFAEVNRKHPKLATGVEGVRGLFDFLGEHNKGLSNEQLVQAMNEYNLYAHEINSVLQQIDREGKEGRESTLVQATHGELPFNEADFAPAQKEELRAFAQELWKELFPESGVDQFTKWATDQRFRGYQNLLAPANGIESAVMGFIALFEPKPTKELAADRKSIWA